MSQIRRFVFQIIILFIQFLVFIGDIAIFLLSLPIGVLRIVGVLIKRLSGRLFVLSRMVLVFLVSLINRIHTPFHESHLPRHKKSKPVDIYPLSFLARAKYFGSGIIFSFFFGFLPLLLVIFLQDLPSPKLIADGQIPQTTKIYDRNGILLDQIYASENRTLVPLENIPSSLQEATIATEDKDFYRHIGFDLTAIIRSLLTNISGAQFQGGSTITQQLVKSTLLSPETSIERKIKEVVLAFWAERIYTKKQILQMYFNQISYGGTAWGVETASEIYFGKHVKDLDLAQSAFLAGMPQAPTTYSPYGTNPTAWKVRQKQVLGRMVEQQYITKQQANDAYNEDLNFLPVQNPIRAPHFAWYVRDLLIQKYGLPMVEKGGLTVKTTLDLKLQDMAQKIVTEEVANDASLHLTNGAAMITNPKNGDILAMVGSYDFSDPNGGNVNVTTALRQPGSSIKVVTYAAAISHGFTAATMLDDSPVTYRFSDGAPSYSPVNYDGRFHGRLPLRLALANSLNIPAVKTLSQVGIDTMVSFAKQMGITTWSNPSQYGLSLTLGSADVTMVDMTTVYGTLANGGVRVGMNPILQVTDDKGNILEQKGQDQHDGPFTVAQTIGFRVLDEGVTFILSNILADNAARSMEFGPNSPLVIPGHTVSVKTGTSDEKRDNWTFGYTPSWLVAVWVGNNDNSPMSPTLASGITGAAPIWHKIMTNLLTNLPRENETIPQPRDIVRKPCLGRVEYFLMGTEKSVNCGGFAYVATTSAQLKSQ